MNKGFIKRFGDCNMTDLWIIIRELPGKITLEVFLAIARFRLLCCTQLFFLRRNGGQVYMDLVKYFEGHLVQGWGWAAMAPQSFDKDPLEPISKLPYMERGTDHATSVDCQMGDGLDIILPLGDFWFTSNATVSAQMVTRSYVGEVFALGTSSNGERTWRTVNPTHGLTEILTYVAHLDTRLWIF